MNATESDARRYTRHYFCNLLSRTRYRCKLKGISYDLDAPDTYEDLRRRVDRGVCEMTGVRLKLTKGRLAWNSPSLDRVDPTKGYIPGNVRVVAHGMNVAMGNWGEGPLTQLVHGWLKQQQQQPQEAA